MGYAFFLDDCDFSAINIGKVTEETTPDSGGGDGGDTPAPVYAVSAETNAALMAICYAQEWAAHEDYMTFEEAAAVTDIGTVFQNNKNIGSFDEFQYFTGVTAIPNSAFVSCTSLTSIVFPQSLQSIGTLAFRYCGNLVAVNFPEATVTVASNALQDSGVQVATINSNELIEYGIGHGGLFSNAPITTIYFGNKVTDYVLYEECIYTVDHKTLVYVPTTKQTIAYHPLVEAIAAYAFKNNSNITSVVLPSTVTTVGESAFSPCNNLTSVSLPSVTSIGNSAFVPSSGIAKIAQISMPSVVTMGSLAFRYFKGTSVDIPSTCTQINNAFQDSPNIISMICRATTPPTITAPSLSGWCTGEGKNIYVPAASVDTYKAANVWSTYASYISAISE